MSITIYDPRNNRSYTPINKIYVYFSNTSPSDSYGNTAIMNGMLVEDAHVVTNRNYDKQSYKYRWVHYDEVDNDEFTIKILGFDNYYGKVCCGVYHKNLDKPFSIEINTDIALELTMYSNMEDGVCSTPCRFYNVNGQLAPMHPDMPTYKDMISRIKSKKKLDEFLGTK